MEFNVHLFQKECFKAQINPKNQINSDLVLIEDVDIPLRLEISPSVPFNKLHLCPKLAKLANIKNSIRLKPISTNEPVKMAEFVVIDRPIDRETIAFLLKMSYIKEGMVINQIRIEEIYPRADIHFMTAKTGFKNLQDAHLIKCVGFDKFTRLIQHSLFWGEEMIQKGLEPIQSVALMGKRGVGRTSFVRRMAYDLGVFIEEIDISQHATLPKPIISPCIFLLNGFSMEKHKNLVCQDSNQILKGFNRTIKFIRTEEEINTDLTIKIDLPDRNMRKALLEIHLEFLKLDLPKEDKYLFIDRSKGKTCKEIKSMLRDMIDWPNNKWNKFEDARNKIRLSDIGGYELTKQLVVEAVLWPILYEEKFKVHGIVPSRGILLYGPPGCSKTMLAKAISNESAISFFGISGPELVDSLVGQTSRNIRNVFEKARKHAPSVIFIDEIDSLAMRRSDTAHDNRVVSTLLVEMDGIRGKDRITVIGATNRPEMLDPALMRPGRFDKHIHVGLPDTEARKQILEKQLREADCNFEFLIESTKGMSGAEIVWICHESRMNALRRSIEEKEEFKIRKDDLIDSLEKINKERIIKQINELELGR
ncbi:ATPase 2 protein [Astathelohania contejeani]|uniref:ATPase 2 protein n=1 Tax=Astathelohania contejeani TaxID=164912 RepID=A0ABQ7HXP5_9MICR|nr:ATPase 2 protein [Thelohania contejeani]